MCGRFGFTLPPKRAWEHFDLAAAEPFEPRRNIAPGSSIPAVVATPAGRALTLFHWGLVPHWAKDRATGYKMINARSETVAQKPAFRGAFAKRRCLIPADRFYEWEKRPDGSKQPYAVTVTAEDGEPALFAMAGLWETWRDPAAREDAPPLRSTTILTTAANPLVARVHDRMPVILPAAAYALWLDETTPAARLQALLAPYPAEAMALAPESPALNNPKNP